ncbi:MAG: radical SAM family heme chaperone HemW [Anaerolineales bacterium]|nr:radical SAM family heme chaperone HemW [Anaerolineales bacterium]
MPAADFGLYLHLPFCVRRCSYCDFFSTEGQLRRLPAYLRALVSELERIGEAGKRPSAGSVFFGGGTPSLLAPRQAARILHTIRRAFHLNPNAEITLEANPGTLDEGRLAEFRSAGINRLSLGVQSMGEAELRMLGRIHTAADSVRTCADARRAGWTNISLDLMFGLPGQSRADWEGTLRRALALEPEHLSLYALTLERGTALSRAVRRGALPAPDEDRTAEMYELAQELLAEAGYRHYEISNWARDKDKAGGARFPAYACQHNLRYWLNLPYLGFGAGAHGCAAGKRYANVRSIEKYIGRMSAERRPRFPYSPACSIRAARDGEAEMREAMWLGLRLTEAGVDRAEYRGRYGVDYCEKFRVEIESLLGQELVEWAADRGALRLAARARLLGNRVFQAFV